MTFRVVFHAICNLNMTFCTLDYVTDIFIIRRVGVSKFSFREELMKHRISIGVLFVLTILLTYQVVGATQLLFRPYVNFPVGDGKAVGIGDFNSDGLNDVAMTTSGQLLILLQNSGGTLASPVVYPAGSRSESLAVGDFNNDSRADIVITIANTIGVFLQQPGGTMAGPLIYETSTGPDAIAVGDVNGDDLDDIAVSHWNAPNIGIFTQTTTGTLNPMVTYASLLAGYDDIDIADVNNDGKNDVIKMNGQGYNPSLSVYLQNTDGTLASALSYLIANCSSSCLGHGVGTGDVTGDGLIDIVLSYGGNRPSSMIAVFAQSPDGNLQPSVSYTAYDVPESVEVADVNADGLADVLTAHGGWNRLGVFLQQNGLLSPYSLYAIPYASHYQPQGMDVGDINNDGLPDVAIADYNNGLVVLYHTPPADITPPTITITAINADNTPYIADTWTNQTVTVKFACSDTESGIAACPVDQVFSAEGITAETTGTATDRVGNSASISFGPIKIDKTSPALLIEVSPNPVLLNGNATLLTNAADMLSGIRTGSMPCFSIDTTTVGFKSATCYVSDNAGNTTSTTADYQVIYDFNGFLSPVIDCTNNLCDSYNLSIINAGGTISLKFQLKDANGNLVLAANAPLWLTPTRFYGTPPIMLPEGYEFQVTNILYDWKKNQQIYTRNWNTKGLPKQSIWLVGARLDDGTTRYVFIALR
jgi:hypothetical protein